MTISRAGFVQAAVVVWTMAAVPAAVRGQDASGTLRLLDVPYLPQSEELCGGAAAAMVMRYWGAADVYADTFADLVDRSAGGIRGQALVAALQGRNWQASAVRGDATLVRSHVSAGRPVIALVEDRPGRFHYVVVVGWFDGRVVVHDPARAPFRMLRESDFLQAWSQTDFWTLLVLPPHTPPKESESPVEIPAETSCDSMVREAVRLATSGAFGEAQNLLKLTARRCPRESAPWTELAGVYALQGDWRAAATCARQALGRRADDEHASRILGTSLFLLDEGDAALDAWNAVGEPRLDVINVIGLDRTRYEVVARELDLQPRFVLTRQALARARRRLADLPASMVSRVSYVPGESGRASVDAAIVERPLWPKGFVPLAATALRAATDREVVGSISNPTGGGEVWSASWRWWEHRPRVALAFSAPAPSPSFGSVWTVEAFSERQTYANQTVFAERRTGAAFTASDWPTGGLRVAGTVGLDRWGGGGKSISIGGSVEHHLASDRIALRSELAALAGDVRSATAGAVVEWRSRTRNENDVWLARAGLASVGRSAPLALWPGAGSGHGRDAWLRAHPLLEGGIVRDAVFGRTLGHGGVEWRRWIQPGTRPWRIAPALFLDSARAWRTEAGFDSRAHLDVGAGLRLTLPASGVLRVDLAKGLRDGATAVSFGWAK